MRNDYTTDQEAFWAGRFGSDYIDRNASEAVLAAKTAMFAKVLSSATGGVGSIIEFGANIGLNLIALRRLLPSAALSAVEINPDAVAALREIGGIEVTEGSMLEMAVEPAHDLTFTAGVLIHIAPDRLPAAYDALHGASRRYVLVAEYYNPSPVAIPYRGHDDRLFKRDFAGELMERHPDLALVDYGFVWRRDPVAPLDDITWFLMEKRG